MNTYSNPIFSTIAVNGEPRFFIGIVGDYAQRHADHLDQAEALAQVVVQALNEHEEEAAAMAAIYGSVAS
jgi:hypothetical protein